MEAGGFINHLEWWMIVVTIGVFCFGTVIPYALCKMFNNQRYAEKMVSRRWMMCIAWYCLLVLIIMLDGEFLRSGIAHTVALCASILSGIFMLSNTLENIRVRKGDIEIDATMSKGKDKKTTKK